MHGPVDALQGHFSLSHCQKTYELLNVKLTMADVMGESAYNDDLANVVPTSRPRACWSKARAPNACSSTSSRTATASPLP
jgi:arginyl-tRNA synthetase (EC 6.1.1.19)